MAFSSVLSLASLESRPRSRWYSVDWFRMVQESSCAAKYGEEVAKEGRNPCLASLPHVCVCLSTLLCPAFPSLPQLRPFALKALNQLCLGARWPQHAASPVAGRPRVRPSLTWTSVPISPQRMCSRPTTLSSKSMQLPRHPAQPLLAVASAEPVRSALPVRCQGWLRAIQHPALPRVSAVPCASATGVSAGDSGKRVVVVSIWQEVGLRLAGPGDFHSSG